MKEDGSLHDCVHGNMRNTVFYAAEDVVDTVQFLLSLCIVVALTLVRLCRALVANTGSATKAWPRCAMCFANGSAEGTFT